MTVYLIYIIYIYYSMKLSRKKIRKILRMKNQTVKIKDKYKDKYNDRFNDEKINKSNAHNSDNLVDNVSNHNNITDMVVYKDLDHVQLNKKGINKGINNKKSRKRTRKHHKNINGNKYSRKRINNIRFKSIKRVKRGGVGIPENLGTGLARATVAPFNLTKAVVKGVGYGLSGLASGLFSGLEKGFGKMFTAKETRPTDENIADIVRISIDNNDTFKNITITDVPVADSFGTRDSTFGTSTNFKGIIKAWLKKEWKNKPQSGDEIYILKLTEIIMYYYIWTVFAIASVAYKEFQNTQTDETELYINKTILPSKQYSGTKAPQMYMDTIANMKKDKKCHFDKVLQRVIELYAKEESKSVNVLDPTAFLATDPKEIVKAVENRMGIFYAIINDIRMQYLSIDLNKWVKVLDVGSTTQITYIDDFTIKMNDWVDVFNGLPPRSQAVAIAAAAQVAVAAQVAATTAANQNQNQNQNNTGNNADLIKIFTDLKKELASQKNADDVVMKLRQVMNGPDWQNATLNIEFFAKEGTVGSKITNTNITSIETWIDKIIQSLSKNKGSGSSNTPGSPSTDIKSFTTNITGWVTIFGGNV